MDPEYDKQILTQINTLTNEVESFPRGAQSDWSDGGIFSAVERRLLRNSQINFTKTELAKYENSWGQLSYLVSEGTQKNFRHSTLRVQERGKFLPDEQCYKRLISKGILFKRTEELVSMQEFGGYRANNMTYREVYNRILKTGFKGEGD